MDKTPKKSTISKNSKIFVTLGVGAMIFFVLVIFKHEPTEVVRDNQGVLVEVVSAHLSDVPIEISASGTVRAKHEVDVSAQVSGRVVWVHDSFIEGGFLKRDTPMFKIEAQDYINNVQISRSEVVAREEELVTVKARARVANLEWELMKEIPEQGDLKQDRSPSGKPSSLVLLKPQLKSAQARLLAARARLSQAELALKRTTVLAPFNCRVRSKDVDVGQYVSPGQRVGNVFGTDVVEVIASLLAADVRWITRVQEDVEQKDLLARLYVHVGEKEYVWNGRFDRFLGEVDSRGRMLRAIIEVDDPYLLKTSSKQGEGDRPILSVGSFVQVSIVAGLMKNVMKVPRLALTERTKVWIVGQDLRLKMRDVQIVRKIPDSVLIDDGLNIGDRIVISNIPAAAPGLKVRVSKADEKS